MNGVMLGMFFCVLLLVGAYLPSLTGHWATLAVPLGAALGLVYLARQPKPQISLDSESLVFNKGRKIKKFNLAKLRFGYARWRVQTGGVVGTVLVLQDDNKSLTIGAYKFMFDDSRPYSVNDTEYCDIYLPEESDFREFLGQFNTRMAVHRSESVSTES